MLTMLKVICVLVVHKSSVDAATSALQCCLSCSVVFFLSGCRSAQHLQEVDVRFLQAWRGNQMSPATWVMMGAILAFRFQRLFLEVTLKGRSWGAQLRQVPWPRATPRLCRTTASYSRDSAPKKTPRAMLGVAPYGAITSNVRRSPPMRLHLKESWRVGLRRAAQKANVGRGLARGRRRHRCALPCGLD